MKTWNRLMIASLLLVAPCFGQSIYKETVISEPSVPNLVLQAFRAAHPIEQARTYLKVETDGALFYKIEVRERAGQHYFSYSPSGELRKTEEVITADELPAILRQSIQEKYPNSVISWAEKTIQDDHVSYRANAKKDDKLFTVESDAEGKLTSAHEVKVNMVFVRMPPQ